MSRFRNLAHVLYHAKCHLIWTPKHRHRVLGGPVGGEVDCCIQGFMSRMQCEVIELNVQPDHVHMVAWILPRLSVSEVTGAVKRQDRNPCFQAVPLAEAAPLPGQPLPGGGVLCGHGGARRGENQALCKMAGGKGAS